MRILHTADWHLGRSLEGRSRLPEQEQFIEELVEIVRDQRIDAVLIAGDVYDSVNPPAAAEELFYDALARLSDHGQRPVIAIAGNHDNPERLAASDPLAVRQRIHLIGYPTPHIVKIDVERTDEQALIYALPYPSEGRLGELLTEQPDEAELRLAYSDRIGQLLTAHTASFSAKTVNIVMSHLFVIGGIETDAERPIQVGGAYAVDKSAFALPDAQYVALGHLHRPQTITSTAANIRYSGSPLAYSFSEAGQSKSVTVLDMQPGQPPQMEEMVLNSGRPLVRWHAEHGIEQVQRWLDEGKDRRAWIELEVAVDDALSLEQIQHLRKQHDGLLNIRPLYRQMETQKGEVVNQRMAIDELFIRFYKRQTGGAQPDDELLQLFLELVNGGDSDETA